MEVVRGVSLSVLVETGVVPEARIVDYATDCLIQLKLIFKLREGGFTLEILHEHKIPVWSGTEGLKHSVSCSRYWQIKINVKCLMLKIKLIRQISTVIFLICL